MSIQLIPLSERYLNYVADYHLRSMPFSFLSKFGKTFLIKLYKGLMKNGCRGFVAEKDGKVVGYIFFNNGKISFVQSVLKEGKELFISVLMATFKLKVNVFRLFEAFFYERFCNLKKVRAELLFIVVSEGFRRDGIASSLIFQAEKQLIGSEMKFVKVSVVSDNKNCLKLILKLGYKPVRSFKLNKKKMLLFVKELTF